MRLSLPETAASLRPTDVRLREYDPRNDPQLAALMFQYGRYLLIGSSRPGCQPANLQGIWNEDMDPAWDAKFTTNINLQMNYWPAEVAGLPECVDPLTQMVKELAETGGRRGEDPLRRPRLGLSPEHRPMASRRPDGRLDLGHVLDRRGLALHAPLGTLSLYAATRNISAGSIPCSRARRSSFSTRWSSIPEHGWLVTCPSTSPENFPACPGNKPFHDKVIDFDLPGTTICAGSTIDMCVLRDLFEACVEAGKILDIDKEFCGQVARARQRLAPLQVGKRGNLQEWIEDWGDLEAKHRHISHLYSLYPSNQISPEATPKLAEAAKVSLNLRGDTGTGFGMAWKAACWARLLDGGHANLCLTNLVALQTCPNLFSKCFRAPQVDGTFGATAAIAEMLLQSHSGEIRLLPALPAAWAEGTYHGLRARGGFEVDAAWKGGRLTSATIRSSLGGPCTIHANCRVSVQDRDHEVAVERPGNEAVRFDTQCGKTYRLTPETQK